MTKSKHKLLRYFLVFTLLIRVHIKFPGARKVLFNYPAKWLMPIALLPFLLYLVYVPNQDKGAITNENGFFSITINATDTLVFSAVNYLI